MLKQFQPLYPTLIRSPTFFFFFTQRTERYNIETRIHEQTRNSYVIDTKSFAFPGKDRQKRDSFNKYALREFDNRHALVDHATFERLYRCEREGRVSVSRMPRSFVSEPAV